MVAYSQIDCKQTPALIDIPRQYNASVDFIDRHISENRGDDIAFIDLGGKHSYKQLYERVNRAGNMLLDLKTVMETRVALCLLDTVDFPAVFWGAIRIGAVPVPLNTLLTSVDYDFMLRDSRAQVLVVSAELFAKFADIITEQPYLRHVIIAGEHNTNYLTLDTLLAAANNHLQIADTCADDVAFWLYTSGSTGTPKGAMHVHSSMLTTAAYYGQGVLQMRADDVVFSAAKLFFAYGLGNAMTFPLQAGACAILLAERPTPASVMAILQQHQPSIFFGVPTLYAAILADPDIGPEQSSVKLRLCVSAGEALPAETAERWQERFGVSIIDGIGSTEMLHIFLSNKPSEIRYNSTGKAVPGYALQVVDEQDKPVAAGEMGELLVSGPSSAMAYWNQRQKSQHTFRGQWTRTGDKYRVDDEGFYYYCGRTDDMLKVSGQWVSPFDVEAALISDERVLEAAVVGQQDENQLIKPKAFVVLKDPASASPGLTEDLKQFVKTRLAAFKYPRWIEFVDQLPKTATGKIQRFKLR